MVLAAGRSTSKYGHDLDDNGSGITYFIWTNVIKCYHSDKYLTDKYFLESINYCILSLSSYLEVQPFSATSETELFWDNLEDSMHMPYVATLVLAWAPGLHTAVKVTYDKTFKCMLLKSITCKKVYSNWKTFYPNSKSLY